MPTIMHVILSAVLLFGSTGDSPAAADSVRVLEAQRQRAMVEVDARALERLLAPGFTYTHSTALVQSREELIAMLEAGSVDYLSFANEGVAFAEFGAVVVVTGKQTIELAVDGNQLTSVSRFTVVWVRLADGWKCVAYQSTATTK